MSDAAKTPPETARLDAGTTLAYERTYLAHERTQIAWIRTALSLISFGFTIAKFFQYLREQAGPRVTVLGPREVGLTMISIGLVSMIMAWFQHRRALASLRRRWPEMPRSTAGPTAVMIAALGIMALANALAHR